MSDLNTCAWCGNEDDCQPGTPGTSGHHQSCCLDNAAARCLKPAEPVQLKSNVGLPGQINHRQLRAIQTAYKHKSRDDRLAEIADLIGRPIPSITALTRREASKVIDHTRTAS